MYVLDNSQHTLPVVITFYNGTIGGQMLIKVQQTYTISSNIGSLPPVHNKLV
jgi:hypothetical protein